MTAKRPLVWGDDTQSLREIRDNETLAGVPGEGGGTVSGDSPALMAGGVALADGVVARGDAIRFRMDGEGLLRCVRASAAEGGSPADALAALVVGERVWFCQHGMVSGYDGLVPGGDVFLAIDPGGVAQTPPWEPGQRVQWGRGALAGSALALALICAAGCGTKVYFVPEGDPVRLRKPIRRAAVWVMDENGRPVASKVTLPAGWFALPDPGADTPEAEEPAVAVEPPAFGVAAPEIPAVPAAPAWAPSVRNVNP